MQRQINLNNYLRPQVCLSFYLYHRFLAFYHRSFRDAINLVSHLEHSREAVTFFFNKKTKEHFGLETRHWQIGPNVIERS